MWSLQLGTSNIPGINQSWALPTVDEVRFNCEHSLCILPAGCTSFKIWMSENDNICDVLGYYDGTFNITQDITMEVNVIQSKF